MQYWEYVIRLNIVVFHPLLFSQHDFEEAKHASPRQETFQVAMLLMGGVNMLTCCIGISLL